MNMAQISRVQRGSSAAAADSILSDGSWVVPVSGPLIAAVDERMFDQRALSRWSDDGGCWSGSFHSEIQEVGL